MTCARGKELTGTLEDEDVELGVEALLILVNSYA